MLQLRLLRRNVFFVYHLPLPPGSHRCLFARVHFPRKLAVCFVNVRLCPPLAARPFLSVGKFLSATLRFMGLKSTLMALPCVHRLESASERIALGLVIRPSQTAMQSRCLFQDPRQVCWKLRWCLGVRPCQLFVLLFAFM